jgi:hypothetical protein
MKNRYGGRSKLLVLLICPPAWRNVDAMSSGREIVKGMATVIVGGILLYEIIVCREFSSTSNTNDYCQGRFESGYSPIPDGCGICFQQSKN